MALADSTARKQAEEPAPLYRSAPHNIEAEQALLGAILVNNEAFYRVSDFLEPAHFFEPIHQKIYQLARDLIRSGATLVLGHHPHVMQGIERLEKGLIAYSLGSFQFLPRREEAIGL